MHGLKVFPISQYYGGERGYFTYSQGYADALAAHAAAVRLGFAAGTTFGDMLASRVGQENAKVERLRAQGKL